MRQLGRIKCLEVQSDNSNANDTDTIILFHGFGADAYDLQTLSDVLPTRGPTQWLFPQGILEVPIGPGWTGRAWWPVDVMALQEASARGQPRDLSTEKPEGLEKIRPWIFDMIERLGVPWNRLILGGFSQGAMLATDIFLRAPETAKGLLIFSGALLNKDEWKKLAPQRAGACFFQSHGKEDTVLTHRGAQQLETLLTQSGLKGHLDSFPGGHEIPPATIQKAGAYLTSL